ncbi:MAG: DUF1176 domain-containing protein [Pseudomonadota bacterium]
MRFSNLPLIAAFAILINPPASAENFTAFDWRASCDADLYCIARTDGASEFGEQMQMKIERSNKPAAPVFVSIRLPNAQPLSEGMQVSISVLESGFVESTEIERVYSGNEMAFSGRADRSLIQELRIGSIALISVEFGGQVGTAEYSVSLTGVTSVLAEIDRTQGRNEREDAIILVGGERLERDEPKGSAAPIASAAERQPLYPPVTFADTVYDESDIPDRVLMTGYRVFNCDFPFVLEGYGAQVYGVTDFLELWIVPCNPADVNVDYYVSLHSDADTEYYDFLEAPFADNRFSLVTNPSWSNETRRLTTWTVYGPDSDCGNFATYEYFTEDDAFDLVRYQEKPDCDGQFTQGEDYPLVWSAE